MVAYSSQFEITEKEEYMAFREFSTPDLIKRFQLRRVSQHPLLEEWLSMPVRISKEVANQLEELREEMDIYSVFYNEAAIRFFFISPLIRLVNYRTKNYRPFVEVPLKGEVDNLKMRGVVDLLIASGDLAPEAPYFFIHEYKKEKGTPDDVVAQLLSAMLVAQELNGNDQAVYGCYVLGRYWHFLILDKKKFSISTGHIASNEKGIIEIYTALVNIKKIIEKRFKE